MPLGLLVADQLTTGGSPAPAGLGKKIPGGKKFLWGASHQLLIGYLGPLYPHPRTADSGTILAALALPGPAVLLARILHSPEPCVLLLGWHRCCLRAPRGGGPCKIYANLRCSVKPRALVCGGRVPMLPGYIGLPLYLR